MKTIEFDQECPECKGTGIYVGMAERDGYGVICHHCKGSGKYHFIHRYEEFSRLKIKDGIVKVVETNPGICLGGNLDFGGMSYNDWLNGKIFEHGMEMRNFVCPNWWLQNAKGKHTEWEECGFGAFSSCKHFESKNECWERYDKEFNPMK